MPRAVKKASAEKTSTKKPSVNKTSDSKTLVEKSSTKKTSVNNTSIEKDLPAKTPVEKVSSERKNLRIISITVAATLVFWFIIIALLVYIRNLPGQLFVNPYSATTKVEYYGEYLGTVERKTPETYQDGGLASDYPKYGYTKSLTEAEREAIIAENWNLCTINTRIGTDGYPKNTYDSMDENGKLYLGGVDTGRVLYKHTGADGLYYGNVSDDEPGIIKRVTLAPRGYNSYSVTGVYAPAGEVIKIQIPEEEMKATGGIRVHIGQALYNQKANNIWKARAMNRMPVILNTMVVDKNTATLEDGVYTAYVGSFLGGPIYIHNTNSAVHVTISGGVRYAHFILGYTTEEEYAENFASSAPMFDLEVRNYGVLHSGPKIYAQNLSYDEIYDAGVLWEKISLVSTKRSKQGIVFLYDPFVAAGAAVAFPGQSSVNCPAGWMGGSLNVKSFVTSGAWGNMHEYNHNFQGWGLPGGGEVTNNALNLVEYSLFTKISSARRLGSNNESLSGWNRYTSPSWATYQTAVGPRGNDLSIYATLLHAFGQENFMETVHSGGVDGYFNRWSELVHYDMSYFASLIGYPMSDAAVKAMQEKGYPVFVPVASAYQTGRSFEVDGQKKYSKTAQPYTIKYDEDFALDFTKYTFTNGIYTSGSVVVPNGFTFRVKNLTSPQYGKINKVEEGKYVYTPDPKHLRSGEMIATIEIVKTDGAFSVGDVEFVIELEQSHEMDKTMLERTTYYFTADTMYENASDAFEASYEGCINKVDTDNINPTQNSNTDVWYTPDAMPADNTIVEVRGKLYADDTAKYRIALRGRWNCALYISLDGGKTYELLGEYKGKAGVGNGTGTGFNAAPYKDIQLNAGDWVYFKAILINGKAGNKAGFVGLGMGKFVPGMPIFDENDVLIGETPETVSVSYASAYRSSYEFPNTEFETDYFYTRDYTYSYNDQKTIGEYGSLVDTNYQPWTLNVAEGQFDIKNLFDGTTETNIHSVQYKYISAENPLFLTVDLGKNITSNRVTFNGYSASNVGSGNLGMPKTFKLSASLDGKNFFVLKDCVNQSYSGRSMTINFEQTTFRYYRLDVTLTDNGKYFAMSKIEFTNAVDLPSGQQLSPDSDRLRFYGDWQTKTAFSSFGHVYETKEGATIQFEFEGSRLGILSTANFSDKIIVEVDGKHVTSIELKETQNPSVSYISQLLADGFHVVKIKCQSGVNIDSIVLW